jgi:hypothetical protein
MVSIATLLLWLLNKVYSCFVIGWNDMEPLSDWLSAGAERGDSPGGSALSGKQETSWNQFYQKYIQDRREIILYEANPMSGVFQILPPSHRPASVYIYSVPPLLWCGGRTHSLVGREGGGGSIFWKTPDSALYCTYVNTLFPRPCT